MIHNKKIRRNKKCYATEKCAFYDVKHVNQMFENPLQLPAL